MTKTRIEVINTIPTKKYDKILSEGKITTIQENYFFKISHESPLPIRENYFQEIFHDSIIQDIQLSEYDLPSWVTHIIDVEFRPGVTDNLSNTTEEALRLVDIEAKVYTGKNYFVKLNTKEDYLNHFADESLGNSLIQSINIYSKDEYLQRNRFRKIQLPEVILSNNIEIKEINLNISDDELNQLSQERCLALTLKELKTIRDYYNQSEIINYRGKHGLPHNPTDLELEVIAQTWSEHCKHKIFAADIEYQDNDQSERALNFIKIGSLYKTYIKKLTKEVEKKNNLDWLVSVFDDNAGIVRFDKNVDLCIKVETHNSPSALAPYGGAITGILGVNRDILGCGLGAKPILNTDVFCFADPSWPDEKSKDELPIGLKHPKRILHGVHQGIEDGGNKSGIPTVNGAIYFDRDFAGKPLVFCGTVGVIPQKIKDGISTSKKKANPGDHIIMVGGDIGADGIHGATMSSLELNEHSPATAVQIGDPLTQKRVLDFIQIARDKNLFSAITDNGAGGLSSSVGEMAESSGGAILELAECPLKYPGLCPYEILISESQERMTLAVPVKHLHQVSKLAETYGVKLSDIGVFTDDGYLTAKYNDEVVGKLNLDFLHHGLPKMKLKATWEGRKERKNWATPIPRKLVEQNDMNFYTHSLIRMLERSNIASKESLVRNYDHEVQAATHIKPFMGKTESGPSNSGVIWLHPHGGEKENGISISCGLNPRLSLYDPYLMAQYAVDEALRNTVATGGNPEVTCMLDNFCWPDPVQSLKTPDGEHKLAALVKTCQGLYDICLEYGIPLVSGKDSMKNDFRGKKKNGEEVVISILPTLLVTAMSKVNINHTCTSGFKNPGDQIYLLGKEASGLLSSEFLEEFDLKGQHELPPIDLKQNFALYKKLHLGFQKNLINSCHDISDGGMLVALTEASFENKLGANINLNEASLMDYFYNEAPGRFIISISENMVNAFENNFQDFEYTCLGQVNHSEKLLIKNHDQVIIHEHIDSLLSHWKKEF